MKLAYLSLLIAGLVSAAPPVDLAGQDSAPSKRRRIITEDDLVYMDNLKSDDAVMKDASRIRFDIGGRSLPNRKGRELHRFNSGDAVTVLSTSKDGHWYAVETLNPIARRAKIKAWVPKSAVDRAEPPKADPAAAVEAAHASEDPAAAAPAENP